jgi:translation elongation factor EF-4
MKAYFYVWDGCFCQESSWCSNSFCYLIFSYKESDLTKLDIQINGECVEPLATIVHRDKVTYLVQDCSTNIVCFLFKSYNQVLL